MQEYKKTQACTHTDIHTAQTHTHTHTYKSTCTDTHKHTRAHTCTHAYTDTHTHTQAHTRLLRPLHLRGRSYVTTSRVSHLSLLVSRINKCCVIKTEFRLFSSVRMVFLTTHKFTSCACQSLVLSVESNVLFAMMKRDECVCYCL